MLQPAIDPLGMSITSLCFASRSRPPDWVDRLLGSRAVFWNTSIDKSNEEYRAPGALLEIPSAMARFRSQFQLPFDAEWPECWIEMLGFARIKPNAPPFRGRFDRNKQPSIGEAILEQKSEVAGRGGGKWRCFYRAMYENWRQMDHLGARGLWATMFYCIPASAGTHTCENFDRSFPTSHSSNTFHLTTLLQNGAAWRTSFDVRRGSNAEIDELQLHRSGLFNSIQLRTEPEIAVCTAWVYLTNHVEKERVNRALVYEFMKYYSNLGMKILVYDRDGANWAGAVQDPYAAQQSAESETLFANSLVYHNYTINSLVFPTVESSSTEVHHHSPLRSDMEGQTFRSRQQFTSDKAYTYTHCRLEAKHRFGIQKVLIIDFDEFLFCDDAPATPAAQSSRIKEFLESLSDRSVDQVMLGKTTIRPRLRDGLKSVKECMQKESGVEQLSANVRDASMLSEERKERMSIFNCFGSVRDVINIPFIKSIHLNSACPFTSRHAACAPCPEGHLAQCGPEHQHHRYYDCICNAKRQESCKFIHLSLVDEEYRHMEASERNATLADRCELQLIADFNVQ